MTTKQLIESIQGADEKARGEAWQSAGPLGAPAVKPLADLMASGEMEVARSAKRALWKVVRYAGRPGHAADQDTVSAELVPLLAAGPANVRREVLWMLSEIGGPGAVRAVADLLVLPELREDARAALQRIPGKEATKALKTAFAATDESYKPALAVSLRARGEKVAGYPPARLVPTKRTIVHREAVG